MTDESIRKWLAENGKGNLNFFDAVDPSSNPYFRAQEHGSGMYSYGAGNGMGYLSQWDSLPGYESFWTPEYGSGENTYGGGINPEALEQYLAANNYTLNEGNVNSGDSVRWVQDASGNIVGIPTFAKNTSASDMNSMLAVMAAGAGAYASGLGAAGAGAEVGAAGAGASGGLSSAELAALYGDVGYGAGMTGVETAAFDAGLAGMGGSSGLGGMEFNPEGITNPNFGQGADFAQVSGANGGGMDWSNFFSSPNVWGQLGSAALQTYFGNKAQGAMLDAGRDSNALQKYMYDTTRADYAPYRAAGTSALSQIQQLLANPGSITSQPDYQFGLDQGTKTLNNGAAARGMTYSGAQGKALQRYGQDYAGTKLNESYNRLASIAGIGQQATNGTTQAGMNYGNQAGNTLQQMGNVRGSGYIGTGNAWGNALGNALNGYQNQQLWDQWGG